MLRLRTPRLGMLAKRHPQTSEPRPRMEVLRRRCVCMYVREHVRAICLARAQNKICW